MKKLMIAVAAVACAAVANAANFNWSIGASGAWFDDGDAPMQGYVGDNIYIVSASDWANFTAVGSKEAFSGLNFLQGPVAYAFDYTSDDVAWSDVYIPTTGFVYGDDDLASLDVVFVNVASDGTGYMTMDMTMTGSSPTGTQVYNDVDTATAASAFGSEYTAFTSPEPPPGPGPDPTPEPTSGLLMLVGLAGLALRRKQA